MGSSGKAGLPDGLRTLYGLNLRCQFKAPPLDLLLGGEESDVKGPLIS